MQILERLPYGLSRRTRAKGDRAQQRGQKAADPAVLGLEFLVGDILGWADQPSDLLASRFQGIGGDPSKRDRSYLRIGHMGVQQHRTGRTGLQRRRSQILEGPDVRVLERVERADREPEVVDRPAEPLAEVAAAGIKLGSDVAEMEACEVESALA